jgi:hypothetical protein
MKDMDDKTFQIRAMDAIMGKHIGAMANVVKKSGKANTYFVPKGGGKLYREGEDGSKKVVEIGG